MGLPTSEGFPGVRSVPFQTSEADAVTLESGLVFEAGLAPYNLKPVVAENYGTTDSKFLQGPRREFVSLFSAGRCYLVLFRQVMEVRY